MRTVSIQDAVAFVIQQPNYYRITSHHILQYSNIDDPWAILD